MDKGYTIIDTLKLPQQDFILFYLGGRLQGKRIHMKGQGNEQDGVFDVKFTKNQ